LSRPYATAGLAGVGGSFKEEADDFLVTEVPLYEPVGVGEHVYALVEKRGVTTLEMLRRLAAAVDVPERELGYAGLKDARGVTRQTVSVPRVGPERLTGLELPGIRVLAACRHGNKLRLGHLAGNRFRIRLRRVCSDALPRAEAVLGELARRGVPNYFGPQRYGSQGNGALVGLRLLAGDFEGAVRTLIGSPDAVRDERWRQAIDAFVRSDLAAALELFPGHCRPEREVVRSLVRKPGEWERAVRGLHPRLVGLFLSAAQSELFDRTVASRIAAIDGIEAGDIAWKHLNGACFRVTDLAEARQRAADFEISPTGPMFGPAMLVPEGVSGAREREILAEAGLTAELFAGRAVGRLQGERRPLRVPVTEVEVRADGEDLLVAFRLPRGAYATAVVREVMKGEPAEAAD
jgi:tRNA pseudouridine13 synthase